MFHGLSAFPLTPLKEGTFDEHSFINLLRPVVDAGMDSLGILGSTGSYAYLTVEERGRIARCAVAHADDIPVIVSIGALRLDDILRLADDAQSAGVSGVLLAPVSYQRLTDEEVFKLYETVTRQLSVPLCIYDNPATTGFSFSDELLFAAAALPNIGSIKLGRVPEDLSVMGYDDQELARYTHPPLSTLVLPNYEMGQKAAETLIDMVVHKKKLKPMTVNTEWSQPRCSPPRCIVCKARRMCIRAKSWA